MNVFNLTLVVASLHDRRSLPKRKFPQRHGTSYSTETVVYSNSCFESIAFNDIISKNYNMLTIAFTRSIRLLMSLHWLPVPYRQCSITYQELSRKHPSYYMHFLLLSEKNIQFRSYHSDLLFVSKVNINIGIRAYSVAPCTL